MSIPLLRATTTTTTQSIIKQSLKVTLQRPCPASKFLPIRSRHSSTSTTPSSPSTPQAQPSHPPTTTNTPSSLPPPPSTPPPLPSLNLFKLLRTAPRHTRYTVYFGLFLLASAESTFWFNLVRAKWFPATTDAGMQTESEFLENVKSAVEGYRREWLGNYGAYYGGYVWGVGEREW